MRMESLASSGLRLGLSEKFGIKLDGTIDYVPSPSAGTIDNYMNLGVQAGLSLLARQLLR